MDTVGVAHDLRQMQHLTYDIIIVVGARILNRSVCFSTCIVHSCVEHETWNLRQPNKYIESLTSKIYNLRQGVLLVTKLQCMSYFASSLRS